MYRVKTSISDQTFPTEKAADSVARFSSRLVGTATVLFGIGAAKASHVLRRYRNGALAGAAKPRKARKKRKTRKARR
jgi:hypothetical protein